MLKNLSLAKKVQMMMALLLFIFLISGSVLVLILTKLSSSEKFTYEKVTSTLVIVGDIRELFQKIGSNVCEVGVDAMGGYSDDMDVRIKTIEKLKSDIASHMQEYSKTFISNQDQVTYAKLQAPLALYYKHAASIIDLYKQFKLNDATELLKGDASKARDAAQHALDDITILKFKAAEENYKNTEKTTSQIKLIVIAITLICFVFLLIMGNLLSVNVQKIINALLFEMKRLVAAAIAGDLDIRADTDKINTEFRPIAQGVNDILDALVAPLKVTADCIEKVALGDIPPNITDEYNGYFNQLKNDINQLIDSQVVAVMAAASISAGDLRLELVAKSESDYYIQAMISMRDSIQSIMDDVTLMASAAISGQLDVRADETRHQGDFRLIVEGLNSVMNAVSAPLTESNRVLQAAADRDLSQRVIGDYQGQIEALKTNVNNTLHALDSALREVAETVGQVNSGAEQIADASQSLSHGATEQASSLEEISSSMAEIGSQAKINADNASQANGLSKIARTAAETGKEKMVDLVAAMVHINDSSNQIGKIIKVIDEIAFQTNLLALNAAVEAARAGRHGKGFAVVADEVRNLAGRSAKAAKETADLIESSKDKVKAGTGLVALTSSSLEEIVSSIIKVTDIIGEIAASSSEQAQGVIQINQGLSQIDRVTQQNTANAEETAAAADELLSQSKTLQKLTGEFTFS